MVNLKNILYKIKINIKLFILVILVILNILSYYLIPKIIHKRIFTYLLQKYNDTMNVKTNIHGNIDNFNNNNLLIMCNHYHGAIDVGLLHNLYYKTNDNNLIYTVVKSNLVGDKEDGSYISSMLYYIKNNIISSLNFITYTRGDKKEGEVVKNIISEYLKNNKNILIFPEGETKVNGIPKDFKHGIFKLAIEHKLNILPITIKYDKDIGIHEIHKIENEKLFDNVADIYIHDIIDSNTDDFYLNNDFMGLKNKTYDIVCSPFKKQIIQTEQKEEIEQKEDMQIVN